MKTALAKPTQGGHVSAYKLNVDQQGMFDLFVSDGSQFDDRLDAILPLAIEVKKIFAAKPRGYAISYACPFDGRYSGNFTEFDQFCERVFPKSARTIRRWLAKVAQTDQRFANKPKLVSASTEGSAPMVTEADDPDECPASCEAGSPVSKTLRDTLPADALPWHASNCTATTILPDVVSLRKHLYSLNPQLDSAFNALASSTELDREMEVAFTEIAETLNDIANDSRERADQWEKVLTQLREPGVNG